MKILTKQDFEKKLREGKTLREMLNTVLELVPSQYLDIELNVFFKEMAVKGILTLIDFMKVKF